MKKIITLLFILFLASQVGILKAHALTLKLKTGEYLTGEITLSDEDGFEFKRWDSEGVIAIKWYHLPAHEITRLKNILNIKISRSIGKVAGEKIFGANSVVYEGVVTDETGENISLKSVGGTRRLAKKDILKRESAQIDILKVYTPQECYNKMLLEINRQKASDQFKMAEYCHETLRMYDKAKEHYAKAAELDTGLRNKANKKIMEIDFVIIREATDQINKYLEKPTAKLIEQAREVQARLTTQFEDVTTPEVAKALVALNDKIDVAEKGLAEKDLQEASKRVVRQYYNLLKTNFRKVSESKISYGDATYYVSSTLPNEIIERLAKEYKISKEDVSKIISGISKMEGLTQKTAYYGDASWMVASAPQPPNSGDVERFIVYQEKMKRINDAKAKAASNNELPTTDGWWQKASSSSREAYLEAFYAERFLSVSERKEKSCPTCNGDGVLKSKICNRCWGTLVDIAIIYK